MTRLQITGSLLPQAFAFPQASSLEPEALVRSTVSRLQHELSTRDDIQKFAPPLRFALSPARAARGPSLA